MKKLLTMALIIASIASYAQSKYTVRSIPIDKLGVDYIQIRATNKPFSVDKWFLVVDFGKPNTAWDWKAMRLCENNEVVKMSSPMNLVNIFSSAGYELVQMGTLSTQGASGSLFYVMRFVGRKD